MDTWSKYKIAAVASLLLVIMFVLWVTNQYQYQTLAAYRCDQTGERVIPRQMMMFQDMLELYVGGWIERGEVTISGLPSREHGALKFSRAASVATISHAYIGEWYEPDIKIVFAPTEGSSCLVNVIYRYR